MTIENPTTECLDELQAKWEGLALLDPLWAVWTDAAHKGGKWKPAALYALGARDVDRLFARLRREGIAFPFDSALDFGSGVGRLTRPLAHRFEHVIGVDISATMIEYAQQSTPERNCVYEMNLARDLRRYANGQFDFVLSRNTLQHVPPGLALGYIAEFVRVLSPAGLAVFQLPSVRKRDGTDSALWAALGHSIDDEGYPRMDVFGIEAAKLALHVNQSGGEVIAAWPDLSVVGWLGYTYLVRRT